MRVCAVYDIINPFPEIYVPWLVKFITMSIEILTFRWNIEKREYEWIIYDPISSSSFDFIDRLVQAKCNDPRINFQLNFQYFAM